MSVRCLPASGLLAALCASAAASESAGTFVAFNDLVPSGGDTPAGAACSWNRYTHGRHWERGGGLLAAEPAPLVDSEGRSSPATVRFEEAATHENTINNHIVPIVLKRGSPAWDEFADCFCPGAVCDEASGECECAALDGSLSYNDAPGWEFKYVFEGLDPQCEAEVAFFVERGGASHDSNTDYNERYSVFTLRNVTDFAADTASALRSLRGGTSLAIRAGNNSAGHVAKWSNIRHNGSFAVSASHGQLGELSDLTPPPHAYKAYAGGVFKLSQVCAPVIALAVPEALEADGGLVVSMALSLTVEDPAAFAADESSPALVAQGVAAVAGVDVSDVTVALSVVWRRLSADRRLSGTVIADAAIAVTDAAAAESLATDVARVEPAALTSSVNEAFTSAGKAEAVSVMEIGAPVIGPPAPPTPVAAETDFEVASRPVEEAASEGEGRASCVAWWLVIAGAIAGTIAALAVVAGLILKKIRRWRVWPAPWARSYTKSDDCSPTSDVSGDREANADVHVMEKVVPHKDDDLNSEFSTNAPSDNTSNASPPFEV